MTQDRLICASDVTVPVTVQTRSILAPEDAFRLNVPIDLSLVFKGWGPFPGVRGVQNQTGAWDAVGQSRNPELTDGSTALRARHRVHGPVIVRLRGHRVHQRPADAHRRRTRRMDFHPRRRRHAHPLDLRVQTPTPPPVSAPPDRGAPLEALHESWGRGIRTRRRTHPPNRDARIAPQQTHSAEQGAARAPGRGSWRGRGRAQRRSSVGR
jgi:hypothetical protein